MRSTLICVLGLFLMNTLCYGQYEDVILESPAFTLFEGDSVTLRCSHRPPGNEKEATFYRDGSPLELDTNHQSYRISDTAVEMTIHSVSVSDRNLYKCKFDGGRESEERRLQVEAGRRRVTLTADRKTIRGQQSVTLTCIMEDSADWEYDWFRKTSTDSGKPLQTADDGESNRFSISQGGIYTCRGRRSEPDALTPESNEVTIEETVSNKAVVTLQPNWSLIYSGETITVRCEIERGGNTRWEYEWRVNNLDSPQKDKEFRIRASSSSNINFMCKGRRDLYSSTEWSEAVTLRQSLNKAKPTLTADRSIIPVGGSVTLSCSVDSSADWKYYWFRRDSGSSALQFITNVKPVNKVSEGGIYQCRAGRGNPEISTEYSRAVTVWKTVSNKAVVTLQPNGPLIYSGETITVRCEIEEGENTRWEYEWRVNNLDISHKDYEYKIISASHSGDYRCKGRKDSYSSTDWSDAIRLTVSPNKPKPTVTADKTITPVGGRVTLSCSVDDSPDWKYDWFRQTSESSAPQLIRNVNPDRVTSVYEGGIYYCRGGRGDSVFYTEDSNKVTIQETVPNKAFVTLQPNWPEIYSGETVTIRCEIQGGGDTKWTYEWRPDNLNTSPTLSEHKISSTDYDSGGYSCRGLKDSYSFTEWSNVIRLTVSSNKPKAKLRADNRDIPVGGSVTLTCSVDSSSSGWKYYWNKSPGPLTTQDAVLQSNGQIKVSQGGSYWCRGGRGDPVYRTEYSDSIWINNIVSNKAVVTLQPNWTEIYRGETIVLRCEIHEGDTEWEYEWKSPRYTSTKKNEYMISNASSQHSGNYRCRGKMKNEGHNSTEWSADITLTVSDSKSAVLTVSPLWLSPGDSVTLSCEVEHPSAGWRFYWYKTVPKLSDNSYIYELLPGSISGTEQDSYIIHGPTHTAGYMCRAGRGDPVYYTQYSKPGFVWSGDVHSAVTLKVSPDRVQHFTSDSVSLSCEGNFTKWRVRSFPENRYRSDWYNWRSMTESTCNIYSSQQSDAVYWCESGSGEFSSAVNITIQKADIILVSPVHPVTEGQSVTLGCKLRTGGLLSNVFFYQNDKLIQNDTRRELNISAVSKSDEGFYKCKQSGKESAQSWMSVQDPAAVVTVSPLWLSPGDSVTLSCEVKHPSAGWRFYWYKTVPKRSDYSYIYELLPGSINGTEQDSYIIHGPTHTAGYMCRAGRGDPVYYTQYSKPGFVWSGDVHSAVTLKVSPDRVQHFTSDSVSLSCEGNFTEWRVRSFFPEDQNRSDCNWRSMTGSTCNIDSYHQSDAVYWCESGSGEFSNAVNITTQNADIILVSPVHPVTEGQSVTLGCKLRTGELLSNVFFYQNDKLIQNDTRRELKISAVSKSDEGFYKCKHSGEESAQSWMSVQAVSRPENSSSLVPLIVGLVCGVVFIILLILLYLYKRSKDSHSVRPIQSESTNQDSATHHMVNLNETQDHIYNSLLHGDVSIYESIRGSEDPENGKV
ncbi:basement membrane-specific heparan sulfate proteoglycan core protein-like [Scomber japonicus]|uniref:basement membrane-specific heparan sulfate proteoglycan core protein-like n=1 Tax=Scomber japonicus TaxID=13676 RepID=UPI0023057469|nr:basement membrane-specific heparan sulfate proteoglycan core protein-like [Scomber japonicus]